MFYVNVSCCVYYVYANKAEIEREAWRGRGEGRGEKNMGRAG